MNDRRRKSLRKASSLCTAALQKLRDAETIVQECRDEEEMCQSNLPESLQDSDRGEKMQESIDAMEEFLDEVDDVTDSIGEMIDSLENACQ